MARNSSPDRRVGVVMKAVLAVAVALVAVPARAEPPPAPRPPAAVQLRWVLRPEPPAPDGVLPKRPVTLEVEVDGITRELALAPQIGELRKDYLPWCTAAGGRNAFALRHDEVAKLTFFEAGYGGFVITRSGDTLTVIGWELEDGACAGKHGEPTACPRRDKQVGKLEVPADRKLQEQIVEIDRKGHRAALDCKSLRQTRTSRGWLLRSHPGEPIEVDLFSDVDAPAWTVDAADAATLGGRAAELAFSQRVRAGTSTLTGSELVLSSKRDGHSVAQWWGFVAN